MLTGLSLALAGCSAVSGRPPTPDRSTGVPGQEREEAEADPRSPQPPAPATQPPAHARGAESRRRERVVELARKHLGARYQWGGTSPSGFDCSGFVRYVYAQIGVSLPHNVARQYQYGTPVSRDRLEVGDLVFFDNLRHNGIYIGQGHFIHARRSGKRVSVSPLDEDWYRTRWVGARRL